MSGMNSRSRRAVATTVALALAALALAACSSNSGGGGSKTYTIWDPYPQYDQSSDWVKLEQKCGSQNGVTIKRTGFDTTDLTNKALLAGQQGDAPDVLILDNPLVSTLAEAGVVEDNATVGLKAPKDGKKNVADAAVVDGKTYGVSIGANTIQLYYSKPVLQAAGVDPASVTDWASLNAALAKITAAGKKGIVFSAIGTEEGAFQFEPWFWGSGANLKKLDSPQGVAAVQLWKDWLDKGYAPNSVLQDVQTTAWQEFATGNFGFVENGSWEFAPAKKLGFDFGIIPIPAQNGGPAQTPTGGEFVMIPVQKDTARYKTSSKIVECLTSTANLVKTDATLSYVAPTTSAQAEQISNDPSFKVWVDAVNNAKSRTGDNLGTDYPKISKPLWTAVQNALSGTETPDDAMKEAQAAATKAIAAK
jgi:multiple sugar transport system substrate-binding protein